METDLIVAVVAAVLGTGGAAALLRWVSTRTKDYAEGDRAIVAAANEVVELVRGELAHSASQLEEARSELVACKELQAQIEEAREERSAMLRYIQYLHDKLEEVGIRMPGYSDWQEGDI